MKPNEQRTPPGGWHFPVDAKVKLEAHDKKTLLDRMFEYRIRNGIPTGNEEADLDNYICTKWKDACNKEPKDYGHPTKRYASENLLYRVSRWAASIIDRMPRGGYPIIARTEADKRGAICAACPQNKNWRTGCRGCSGSTVSLLNQARRMQKSPPGLMGCQIAGWDNGTAVFFPNERLPISEEMRQSLPDNCWRK